MSNLNKVLLMGRLTRDPELRYIPSGTAVMDIGLAVNRTWGDSSGERREEATFVDVTVWGKQAELIQQYKKKGEVLFIEGRLTLDTWQTQDGEKRSKLKVVCENFQFVGSRGGGGGEPRGGDESRSGGESRSAGGGGGAGGGGAGGGGFRRGGTQGQPAGAPSYQEYEYPSGGGSEPVDDSEIPF